MKEFSEIWSENCDRALEIVLLISLEINDQLITFSNQTIDHHRKIHRKLKSLLRKFDRIESNFICLRLLNLTDKLRLECLISKTLSVLCELNNFTLRKINKIGYDMLRCQPEEQTLK